MLCMLRLCSPIDMAWDTFLWDVLCTSIRSQLEGRKCFHSVIMCHLYHLSPDTTSTEVVKLLGGLFCLSYISTTQYLVTRHAGIHTAGEFSLLPHPPICQSAVVVPSPLKRDWAAMRMIFCKKEQGQSPNTKNEFLERLQQELVPL